MTSRLWVRVLGLAVLAASTVFTLWARFSLGTSWSVAPKVHGDHQLRIHGPYAVTRHPIYTGVLGMLLGATLLSGIGQWIVLFPVGLILFEVKIRMEEHLMLAAFPADYPILDVRARRPQAIAEAAARRKRRPALLGDDNQLFIIAADHPARGALRVGERPMAMADRAELIDRLSLALGRPGVDGVLGTADIIEDLLLLGVLDDKVVIGSMNRGGLAGTVFEIDDRFTGYDAAAIARMGFDGGKMLFRIDPDDPATALTMESCAQAVSDLAAHGLMAMVEPFISHRVDGRVRNDLSPEAVARSIAVASGLGATSAYTWLKVPVVEHMERVLAASTLPALLLAVFPANVHMALSPEQIKGLDTLMPEAISLKFIPEPLTPAQLAELIQIQK